MTTVPAHERGVALLSTLVIVAAVSILLLLVLEQTSGTLLLARNARSAVDMQLLASNAGLLAEQEVRRRLPQLEDSGPRFAAALATPQTMTVGGQPIVLSLQDAADCFNLNSLVQQVGPGIYVSAPPMLAQMRALLITLGLSDADAESLSQASADWIDSDSASLPRGAEDAAYLSSAKPHRTGNTLMADVSEWQHVRGMTPALYARLAPWFCALPMAAPAPLAINTLRPERAPLLAALALNSVPAETVQALLARRPAQGWADTVSFWQDPLWQAAPLSSAQIQQVVLVPQWLWIVISITQDDISVEEALLLALQNGRVQPIRQQERFIP
jgi:general secretion pathway protein K